MSSREELSNWLQLTRRIYYMWCARAFIERTLQWLKWLIGVAYARRHLSNGTDTCICGAHKTPVAVSTSKHSMMDGTILHTNSENSHLSTWRFTFFASSWLFFVLETGRDRNRRGEYVYRVFIDKGMKRDEVEVGIVNLWNVNLSRTDVYGEQIEWAADIEATAGRAREREKQSDRHK